MMRKKLPAWLLVLLLLLSFSACAETARQEDSSITSLRQA